MEDRNTEPVPDGNVAKRTSGVSGIPILSSFRSRWTPAPETGYDAFLSYDHDDRRLAESLQRETERLATPWFRARSVRVFRDVTSLPADPNLRSGIEDALKASRWLVLLASPASAESHWVQQEITWWLANKASDRILIALTDGTIVWDQGAGRSAPETDALSPALIGVLADEPLWVDLRWARDVEQIDRHDPRLRDAVASLSASIRDEPKDSLIGEHLRQQRRTRLVAGSGVTALALLTILAVALSFLFQSASTTAEREAREALSRAFAASATSGASTGLQRSELMAAAAYQLSPNPQTSSVLFDAVTRNPRATRFVTLPGTVTSLTASFDGSVVVAGTDGGQVTAVRSDRAQWSLDVGGRTTSVAASNDGSVVVAGTGDHVTIWHPATGARRDLDVGPLRPLAVAVSRRGDQVAVLGGPKADVGGTQPLALFTADGRRLATAAVRPSDSVSFAGDANLQVDSVDGTWQQLTEPGLKAGTVSPVSLARAEGFSVGHAPNGQWFALQHNDGDRGAVDVWGRLGPSKSTPDLTIPIPAVRQAEALAVNSFGDQVAIADGATIGVYASGPTVTGDPASVTLTGIDSVNIDMLQFLGETSNLVSASGNTLAFWDLSATGSVLHRNPSLTVAAGPRYAPSPVLSLSPDDSRLAVLVNAGSGFGLIDRPTGDLLDHPRFPDPSGAGTIGIPVWSADGRRIRFVGGQTDGEFVLDLGASPPRVVGARTAAPGTAADIVMAAASADGSSVLTIDRNGRVQERRDTDGAVLRSTLAPRPPGGFFAGLGQGLAAVDPASGAGAIVAADGSVTVVNGPGSRLPASISGSAQGVQFAVGQLWVLREDATLEAFPVGGSAPSIPIRLDPTVEHTVGIDPYQPVVVTLLSDGTLEVVDRGSGVVLARHTLPPLTSAVADNVWAPTGMTFTHDDHVIVATSSAPLVDVDLRPDSWIRAACVSAGRNLTEDEWQQFGGTSPQDGIGCG